MMGSPVKQYRAAYFIANVREADTAPAHEEDCLCICLCIEAYWHLRTTRPQVACVYGLDLIQDDFAPERAFFVPTPYTSEMARFVVAFENLLREKFTFLLAIQEIVNKVLAAFHCEEFFIFRYEPEPVVDYDIDTELSLGVHGIIRHFLERENKATVHDIPVANPQRRSSRAAQLVRAITRLASIGLLRVIFWSSVIILKLRTARKPLALLFGADINLTYCRRLAACFQGPLPTVYMSRYDSIVAWVRDLKREHAFILPLTLTVWGGFRALHPQRARADFVRQLVAHLTAIPRAFLRESYIGDRLAADLYAQYLSTQMFRQVSTLVHFLRSPVQLCAFEAGQCAGFFVLVSELLTSGAEPYVERINIWFHGSSDRSFASSLLQEAWNHPKIRFFVRNRIERDLLIASGVSPAHLACVPHDPVLMHDQTGATAIPSAQRQHPTQPRAGQAGKKILVLTAGGGWLRCGINLRTAHEALYTFLVECGRHPDLQVVLKPHPRGDFFQLYMTWAKLLPNLVVVRDRLKFGDAKRSPLHGARCSDGDSLDALLATADVVLSGPIFNSAVLKAVRHGLDVIFPTDGLYANAFIATTFPRYLRCVALTPALPTGLERLLGMSAGVQSRPRTLYDLSDIHGPQDRTGGRDWLLEQNAGLCGPDMNMFAPPGSDRQANACVALSHPRSGDANKVSVPSGSEA
jgi:hypothetical protein